MGAQLSLDRSIGLFFLARDVDTNVSAVPQAALTIVLLIFVILFQVVMHMGYSPLVDYLPLSMASQMNANEANYAREIHHEKQRKLADGRNAAGADLNAPNGETSALLPGQSASMHPRGSNGTAASQASDNQNNIPQPGNKGQEDLARYDSQATAGQQQHQLHPSQTHHTNDEDLDELGDLNENAFYHPALWKDQPMLVSFTLTSSNSMY